MKIIDITKELLSARIYDGDPSSKVEKIASIDDGDKYNLSSIFMCAHNGTHIDAPNHFIKDGMTVDEMAIDTFLGECFVARGSGEISGDEAERILKSAKSVGAEKRILLKGDLTVTKEAAEVFSKAKIKLLGNEDITFGAPGSEMAVHKILLSCGVCLLEGIDLRNADEGKCFLSCAP